MRSIINIIMLDDASIIKLFWIFKLGIMHPDNVPGVIKGIIIGIWRFEIQIIFGFWNKSKQIEEVYES